jgi:hypothetical protein
MPFHWHDAVVRVDVHAPRRPGQVATVTVEGVCLSTHEARMLARQLEAAADIADDINVPILDNKRAELAERIACKNRRQQESAMKLTSIAQSWNGIVGGDVDPE